MRLEDLPEAVVRRHVVLDILYDGCSECWSEPLALCPRGYRGEPSWMRDLAALARASRWCRRVVDVDDIRLRYEYHLRPYVTVVLECLQACLTYGKSGKAPTIYSHKNQSIGLCMVERNGNLRVVSVTACRLRSPMVRIASTFRARSDLCVREEDLVRYDDARRWLSTLMVAMLKGRCGSTACRQMVVSALLDEALRGGHWVLLEGTTKTYTVKPLRWVKNSYLDLGVDDRHRTTSLLVRTRELCRAHGLPLEFIVQVTVLKCVTRINGVTVPPADGVQSCEFCTPSYFI